MGFRSTRNLEATQIINYSISGENMVIDGCDDYEFDNTVPCEDTFLNNDDDVNNDEFDTQVIDVDVETQPVDLDDETQVMDLAGETQPMDDYDFDDHLDTQRLDLSDDECSEGTQPFDDAVGSIDVLVEDRSACPSTSLGEKGTSLFHQAIKKDKEKTMPSENVAQSSGSLKRGFASVRTASLRAAGLAARQTASKIADDRSRCSELRCSSFDDTELIANSGKVGVENYMTKCNEEGLTDGDKSNVARSLARKLFMEEDATEMEPDADHCDRNEDLPQNPSSDNNLAGLSYVDSQEPGDLSQANALEFVDKFLKVNMFESGQGINCKTLVGDTGIPGSITKGAQSIAQKASRRSTLAEASIYEWDDNLEDEGGGDFFTKKKEVLLGHNSCPRPQNSKHHELRVSRTVGKSRNEKKKKVVHDTIMGFLCSDLKYVNSGEKGEVNKRIVEENDCSGQPLEALPSAQSVDMQNVGIDTQMAAEAIEALSTGSALMNNASCVAGQSGQRQKDYIEKETMGNGLLRQSSNQERARLSRTGVVTRSRTKGMIMKSGQESNSHPRPETHRWSVTGKLAVSLVKPHENEKRSSINDVSVVSRRNPSETEPMSVSDKQNESILEQQVNTYPHQPKRRSLRGNSSIHGPAVQKVVQCIENPTDLSGNCRGVTACLEAVRQTRSMKRKGVISENFNNRKGTVDIATTADHDKVDGSYSKRGVNQRASRKDHQSANKGYKLSAFGGPELTIEFIATRTRSKRSCVQDTEHSREKKGLLFSGVLLSKDDFQSSLKKQDAGTPPGKETLISTTIDVTPESIHKSSHQSDVTPVHLKRSISEVSPVCIGDGYQTPSCKRRVSLTKECINLISSENGCSSPFKGLRQRRDMNDVRVLFSQHLDDDIIKQQKKILSRLGVSVASTILEATHFVADYFVRTRNMLEAIAKGKPVVTHFWLENCGQANCFIDEKNYILRDAKKEKELGFSMPKSLAHASHYPILESKRVLITPNIRPGKDVISSLVKSVGGQAVERWGKSILNSDTIIDDLLALSCEEDYGVSVPLLEKGIAVYSSELLLNGIITQRLDYERYRLFVSHVKRTRSNLWVKKGEEQVFPASKIK